MNRIFGYARVSAEDQNLSTQIETLKAEGCYQIYQEKITGSATDRSQLTALLNAVRPGDTVIVSRFFRLGRNTKHLLEVLEYFKTNGVEFRALDLGVDSSTPAGKMMMSIFAAFAEYQRDEIKEKTAYGREVAKANGTHMGRKPGLDSKKMKQIELAMKNSRSVSDISNITGVPISTVKRYKKYIIENN